MKRAALLPHPSTWVPARCGICDRPLGGIGTGKPMLQPPGFTNEHNVCTACATGRGERGRGIDIASAPVPQRSKATGRRGVDLGALPPGGCPAGICTPESVRTTCDCRLPWEGGKR